MLAGQGRGRDRQRPRDRPGRGHAGSRRTARKVVVNDLGVATDGSQPRRDARRRGRRRDPGRRRRGRRRRQRHLHGRGRRSGDPARARRVGPDRHRREQRRASGARAWSSTCSEPEWDDVIRVHLKGTFAVTAPGGAVVAQRAQGGRGGVRAARQHVAPGCSLYGGAGQSNYVAAKAGILAFTEAIATELAPYGVTVEHDHAGRAARGSPPVGWRTRPHREARRPTTSTTPSPVHVAELVCYLASPTRGWMSGQYVPGERRARRARADVRGRPAASSAHDRGWTVADLEDEIPRHVRRRRPAGPTLRRRSGRTSTTPRAPRSTATRELNGRRSMRGSRDEHAEAEHGRSTTLLAQANDSITVGRVFGDADRARRRARHPGRGGRRRRRRRRRHRHRARRRAARAPARAAASGVQARPVGAFVVRDGDVHLGARDRLGPHRARGRGVAVIAAARSRPFDRCGAARASSRDGLSAAAERHGRLPGLRRRLPLHGAGRLLGRAPRAGVRATRARRATPTAAALTIDGDRRFPTVAGAARAGGLCDAQRDVGDAKYAQLRRAGLGSRELRDGDATTRASTRWRSTRAAG